MKDLKDYLLESIPGHPRYKEPFQAFCVATSYSTNPPLDFEDMDRCDFSVGNYLSELLDKESSLDEKKVKKYKEFLDKNEDLLDSLFVLYLDNPGFGKKYHITVMINRHADEDNDTYYVMTYKKGIDDTVEWLKSNLSKCVSFAKSHTVWKG